LVSLADSNKHQNGGNCKRHRVAACVETEHVTCASTNKQHVDQRREYSHISWKRLLLYSKPVCGLLKISY